MAADPGWHPDPSGRHQRRYWDGHAWTAHVSNDGVPATDEIDIPAGVGRAAAASTGNGDSELAALQEADERGDAEASVLLGQALRRLGRYDEARAAYDRGDQRGHPEAAMSLGNMLSEVGDTAGARVAFERGIVAGSTMAAFNLGLMLADMGEVDDALHYLQIARDKDRDIKAHWAIGKLLEKNGDRMGAIESYQAGVDAGDAQAAYDLGFVFYDLGDTRAAKTAFEKAEALGHDGAKETLEMLAKEPDGALARQLAHELAAACKEAQRLHDACFDSCVSVQKAQYVLARPQAPASRDAFMGVLERRMGEFDTHLSAFTAAQAVARDLWARFQSASGASGEGMDKLLIPLQREGSLDMDEVNDIMVGGIIVAATFGSTMDEFIEVENKLAELMRSSGN